MLGFLKKRGRGDKTDQSPVVEMMGLTIGRTVEIDPLAFKFWPDDCLVEAERDSWLVVAQGLIDLGEGSFLHRFYPADDNSMIQVQGGDGVNHRDINEIMIWTYFGNSYPRDAAAWQGYLNQIKQPRFQLGADNTVYDRVWFADETGETDPMSYWETVYDNRSGTKSRRIFQTAMLYGRELSDGSDEMLLVNMEEPDFGDRSVCYMLGKTLNPQNFN